MEKHGTFEEVLGKVWDLNLRGNPNPKSVRRFLKRMRCFDDKDIDKLIKYLEHTEEPKGTCWSCGEIHKVNQMGFCSDCWARSQKFIEETKK